MWQAFFFFVAAIAAAVPGASATIFSHGWDTVADVMGMHGKFSAYPTDEASAFIAGHYPGMATIGCGCEIANVTMEDASVKAARKIKAINPDVRWTPAMLLLPDSGRDKLEGRGLK